MGEARDGLERLPQPDRLAAFGLRAQRFDRVAAPVDRMPLRHEAARLGEEQEQHPIHHGQRLRKGLLEREAAAATPERGHQMVER